MLTVPLASVSAVAAINSVISTEDGSKRAETGDDFAALLGLQVAVAAGETKPGPAIARPVLPKDGKALPVAADVTPETFEPTSPDLSASDDRLTSSQPELLTLQSSLFAQTAPASNALVAAQPVAAFAPPPAATTSDLPVPLAPKGAKPTNVAIQPNSEALVSQPKFQPPGDATKPNRATEVTTTPDDDATGQPAQTRPNSAPPFALPGQAAARAVLVHSADAGQRGDPIKPAPVLPEQAAAQATLALAARGIPERLARSPEAATGIALPTDPEAASVLPLAPRHRLNSLAAEQAQSVDSSAPLVTANLESDPQSAPQATTIAPASVPAPARHEFTAMIDRLIEARDLAGAQPIAMTLRHEDFGTVSLNFRTADDGLTVTMASPDPEFARAVGAAAASGAMSQSDLTRHSGETASSRQHSGGSLSEDSTGQSRDGSREAERDGSRQRRDQPPPQRSAAREQGRSGIFA